MCLAIPGQIVEINGPKKATVNFGGMKKVVDTTFLDSAEVGEYVLVHVGCAIQKVEEASAREMYRLLGEIRKEDLAAELAEKS